MHRITSKVERGRLKNPEPLRKAIQSYEGKNIVITVKKKTGTRSLQQNAYYHVLVTIMAKELGYHHDEMHEIIKFKFLKFEKPSETTGEIMTYLKSTTELNKEEFGDLIDGMMVWAAEMDIILPTPEEQLDLWT